MPTTRPSGGQVQWGSVTRSAQRSNPTCPPDCRAGTPKASSRIAAFRGRCRRARPTRPRARTAGTTTTRTPRCSASPARCRAPRWCSTTSARRWASDDVRRPSRRDLRPSGRPASPRSPPCPNVVAKLGGLAMPDNGFGWHEARSPADLGRVRRGPGPLLPPHDRVRSAASPACSRATSPSIGSRCRTPSTGTPCRSWRLQYSDSEQDAMFSGTARRVYRLAPIDDSPGPGPGRSIGSDGELRSTLGGGT